MKYFIKLSVGLVVLVFASTAVYAQFARPEDAVTYRKAAMQLTAHHFKALGAMVQGKVDYNKETFASHAAVVKMLATLPWEAMMLPGTDKGPTTLSSKVFEDTAKFKAAASSFEGAAGQLAELAAAGDFSGAKGAFGAVAGNCKGCHSQFRTR